MGQTSLVLVTIILVLTLGTFGIRFVHNSPSEVLKSQCDLTQRVILGHLELGLQSGNKVAPFPPQPRFLRSRELILKHVYV